jgi:hypothetical protein
MTQWQPLDTIPHEFRDGRWFMARTADFENGRESNARIQKARWSGETPDDPSGHFASRNGQMVTHWMPQDVIPAEQAPKGSQDE